MPRNSVRDLQAELCVPGKLKSQSFDRAYVSGGWISAERSIPVANPATGEVIGAVPDLSVSEMERAIDGAVKAFRSWSALLAGERSAILRTWAAAILTNKTELAALLTAEQGKPLRDAEGEIEYGAGFVQWFAEEALRTYGEIIPPHLPDRKMLVQREPLGVVGLATPWNFPSAMLTRKAAAALAAGCTIVAVPSPETPLSALALAQLAEQAGVPPGVFSVLTGDPPTLVGELCRDARVRGLSFTGSTHVGRLLAAQCAPTLKRLSLELGGHAPFLVFEDANIEAAAEAAVAAKFQTSGQDCLAANRIFVHHEIYEAFLSAFAAKTAQIKVGVGTEAETELGPLINQAGFDKSAEHVADALGKGAKLILGGGPHPLGGLFFAPTVLADVTPEMKIMREETFGPVASLLPFADEDELVHAANDTEFGLAAYVFTNDLARAHRISDTLEFGMVAVNTVKMTGSPVPFGGVKQSGFGREGSHHGINEFTELKYVCLGLQPAVLPHP